MDQLDPAALVFEGVQLGAVPPGQAEHGFIPSNEHGEPELGRVALPQALVAGGGVRGLVGGLARAPRDLVDAVGLARGDVHADERGPGGHRVLGVRVHEVQVVVRVREDLHHQRAPALHGGAPRDGGRTGGGRLRGGAAGPGQAVPDDGPAQPDTTPDEHGPPGGTGSAGPGAAGARTVLRVSFRPVCPRSPDMPEPHAPHSDRRLAAVGCAAVLSGTWAARGRAAHCAPVRAASD